ncbi:MAG: ABC transporter ATP-binding protein [Rhizobiaceae bacterium]
MSGLQLSDVKKSFGDVDVIRDVDFSIDDGEFTVFVGPSGCGKSTLLRLVAGLEEATSGQIQIGGRDVTHVEPAERGVAMVFQSYALYPHMSVAENMGFGLKMTGHPESDINERVTKAASILHLDQLLERKPKQLSGGQRQRVAIGRAIVREPQVFLFDEPLSNLDAELRVKMRLEIAKLHKDLGATMIYVTHDQVEAMTLADKIVVLRAGKVEQIGTPIDLYDDPDNVFVAGFIGSPRMNFLNAVVASNTSGKCNVTVPDFANAKASFTLKQSKPEKGRKLLLGIRPEHFETGGKIKIKTEVDAIENLGGISYAYARSEDAEPLTIDIKDDRSVKEGSSLKIGFDVDKAMLFDPETELRLR